MIRTVFLHAADSYSVAEAAFLTETSPATLRREVRRGDRDAQKIIGRGLLTWRQMAFLALDRWTLTEIHDALGDDAEGIFPPLLALRFITVRLPEYVVRALKCLAADSGKMIDDYLYGELIDFAGIVAGDVEKRLRDIGEPISFRANRSHLRLVQQAASFDAKFSTPPSVGYDSTVSMSFAGVPMVREGASRFGEILLMVRAGVSSVRRCSSDG